MMDVQHPPHRSGITMTPPAALSGSNTTMVPPPAGPEDASPLVVVVRHFLLFVLLAGLAGTVDFGHMKAVLIAPRGVAVGLLCQVVLLPFLGFVSVNTFHPEDVVRIQVLVTTMVPGGALSNYFCSLFNADLALSIAMTTASTLLSLLALPLNVFLYIELLSGTTMSIPWGGMIESVCVAAGGLLCGLLISAKRPTWKKQCGVAATVAVVLLTVYTLFATTKKAPVWDRCATFYLSVAFPCVMGIFLSHLAGTAARLTPQQGTAVTVECSYQNIGIATSLAFVAFPGGDEQAVALGVPVFYGACQGVMVVCYCTLMWKLGRSYAPPSCAVWEMLKHDFQPADKAEKEECLSDSELDSEAPAVGSPASPTSLSYARPSSA